MALIKKSIHQDTLGRCDNERMAHVSLAQKIPLEMVSILRQRKRAVAWSALMS
jgi:hypothetical protein